MESAPSANTGNSKSSSSREVKLSIIMPVRNEGPNIRVMLKVLNAVVEINHEILIVHDTPDDTSIPIIKEIQGKYSQLHLIHNTLGKGVANAIKAGIRASKGKYILLFAVDEVGPVLAIEDMAALLDQGCDMVSATRYAHGGRRLGGSLIGSLLSRTGNKAFKLLSGSSFTDSTTGIKMFKKSIFNKMTLESKPVGWAVVFELAIKAQVAGLSLGEVPIVSIDRLYGGKSTFKVWPWLKEYLRWFIWGAKRLHGRQHAQIQVRIPSTTVPS